MAVQEITEELDEEWVDLILEALELGLTPDEIRLFLKKLAFCGKE